jgi:microcystin-dependent protein
MSQPFIGEIKIGGWNFAPVDWSFCDGSLVSIAQNSVLFQLIGTTYGGDGQNTYALPDLRGRGALGLGNSAVIGAISGTETATINLSQYPQHNHAFNVNSVAAGLGQATNHFLASTTASPSTGRIFATPGTLQPLNSTGTPPALTSAPGSSQPHENMQPYLAMTYVIAMFGVFPSQN